MKVQKQSSVIGFSSDHFRGSGGWEQNAVQMGTGYRREAFIAAWHKEACLFGERKQPPEPSENLQAIFK